MRLYLYKLTSYLLQYPLSARVCRVEPLLEARLHCNGGCIVDSGTPLPSKLPHWHDLALHSSDCFEHFLARDEGEGHYACNRNGPVHLQRYTTACVIAGCRSHTTDDQRTAHQATKGGCLYKHRRTRWILRMHLGFCI